MKTTRNLILSLSLLILFGLLSCSKNDDSNNSVTNTYEIIKFDVANFSESNLSTILSDLKDNTILQFGEGVYNLNNPINISGRKNIFIKGAGRTKTIFDFKNSVSASSGGILTSQCENLVLCGFTVKDTKGSGNGVEARNVNRLRINDVGVVWSIISENNGIYGIYPVLSNDVIVENCYAKGARDAGIYSGQSRRVILRSNTMESNVMGMEIENNVDVIATQNTFKDNTAGLLVYDLAGLSLESGSNCKVEKNTFMGNNRKNFAPLGSTFAANAPAGTGILLASTTGIEITQNTFSDQKGIAIIGTSYYMVDPGFDSAIQPSFTPFLEDVNIYGNTYNNCGNGYSDDSYITDLTDRSNGQLIYSISTTHQDKVTPFARYMFEYQNDLPSGYAGKPTIEDASGTILYMNFTPFLSSGGDDPSKVELKSFAMSDFSSLNGYIFKTFSMVEPSFCP